MKLNRDKISLTLLVPVSGDFTLARAFQLRRGSSLERRTQNRQTENEKRAAVGRKAGNGDKRIKRFFERHENGVDYVFYEDLTEAVAKTLSSCLIIRET